MATDPHRQFCQRQHRVFGHFLSVEAWRRGLDCIVVERADLEAFLGLQKFKSARVKWLKEDLKPWFPHQVHHYFTKQPSSIHSLYLSRVSIEEHLPKGSMTAAKRVSLMATSAPKAGLFFGHGISHRPGEAEIVSRMARLAAGLETP